MTNEEIMQKWYNNELLSDELLNLARADERAKLAGLYHSQAAVDAMIAEEREKLQGVDVWVAVSKHYAEIYIGGDEPNRMIWGHFYKSSKEQHCSRLNRHTARLLGVELNQCAKFNIVRCE